MEKRSERREILSRHPKFTHSFPSSDHSRRISTAVKISYMGTVGSNPTLKDTHKRACKRIVSYFPSLSFQSISKIIRKKKLVQTLDPWQRSNEKDNERQVLRLLFIFLINVIRSCEKGIRIQLISYFRQSIVTIFKSRICIFEAFDTVTENR